MLGLASNSVRLCFTCAAPSGAAFLSPGETWISQGWRNVCYTATSGAIRREVMMTNPTQPSIQLTNTADYRENYANSVQVRVNVWDFFLVFGTLRQQDETKVEVNNFQGVYLSPQQAKALYTILQQNLVNYEGTFGEIKLDPRMTPGGGPIH